MSSEGLDQSGNVADPIAWLNANPKAPQWLREIVTTLVPHDDINAVLADVIQNELDVTPGFAAEVARVLREALTRNGLTIHKAA